MKRKYTPYGDNLFNAPFLLDNIYYNIYVTIKFQKFILDNKKHVLKYMAHI